MSFGEGVAETYDAVAERGEEQETVAFLARLAGDGPALELAIGTGRIGLPLAWEVRRQFGLTAGAAAR